MQIFKEEEIDRIYVLRQVKERKLTQSEAGRQLGLSERQIRRLLERMSEDISEIRIRKRGGNRAFKEEFKQDILAIVREKYPEFGPTFASEKLEECDRLAVNRETLRQWMMEDGLWHGKMRKNAKTHQSRQRRSRFGELVHLLMFLRKIFHEAALGRLQTEIDIVASRKVIATHFVENCQNQKNGLSAPKTRLPKK
ncbi:hypothetical protein FACS189472_00990 [Alphaproteobacteria bacterium]|nr:hypothetical protein FACS189472_00990 [Alphaproteobacteria bacterium]